VSGESYVITSNTQIDLLFGINTATTSYIYKVVIEKGAVEIPTEPAPSDPTDEPTKKVTVHTIGDSTMSSYDQSIPAQKGMDGWGDYLADCMKSDWTAVYNWADRGETAKSYYGGIWTKTSADRPEFAEPVMDKVQAGDYVIIQFGHNDSKAYSTVKYEEWLGTLVDAVKAKGATPIIASSICRARFGNDGKITRLGRIDTYEDSNRILEDGTTIDDYTFDYPYHAKKVAEAKSIEFIDVTSGVKEMFETYGEAKTKALFPTGEKTHTNKLGAQLIAKVAAKLLLNTALKNYVNTTTLDLPSADDIDIIIDDFKDEAVVTKKTIWTFNDYKDGDVIAEASDSQNNVVDLNGLYARSFTNRAINAVTSPVSMVTFSDGTAVDVSVAALTSQNYNPNATTIAQNTAGRSAASALAPTFALNVGAPGTFYCILAPTKNNSDRQERILFSGKDVVSVPVATAWGNDNHLCELKYHAETTGVIYLAAGITSNFYALMFVPDMEGGTEEDWNYQMVLTRSEGWWTYSNLSGNNQQVAEGLKAYAVSAISSDGKAVLSDVGEVIADGMAVVVKGEPDTEYALVSTTSAATYTGTNLLVKNDELRYLPATEENKTNYYFDGTQFVKATGGETIHEKQAYLRVASEAETVELTIETPSAISQIEYGTLDADNYYDLQGRKVANPTRGIYIQNGRKYVVR
jgi:lysophospholipase L1-like esterase